MVDFDEDGSLKVSEEFIKYKINNTKQKDRARKTKLQLKNHFFRNKIFEKYHYKCSNCGRDENSHNISIKTGKNYETILTIHHKKYDWGCPFMDKGLNPNCAKCFEDYSKLFNACLNNCKLLCYVCHNKEHYLIKEQTGNWTGYNTIDKSHFNGKCRNCGKAIEKDFLYCPYCDKKLK